MIDYCYRTPPFQHQEDVFLSSRDKKYFALLMEQGTGKTKVIIDTACYLYGKGEIDLLLVVAPNGVHANWVINEIPAHAPEHYNVRSAIYRSQPNKKEAQQLCSVTNAEPGSGLKCVAMNVDAFTTTKGVEYAEKLLHSFRTMLVVDESSVIKNHSALRTKALLRLAKHAVYRRIMTGTPVTQGPLDVFTQFFFLDEYILRTQSFFAFRNMYAVMVEQKLPNAAFSSRKKNTFMKVTGYKNLEKLQALIEPHSFRVTKRQCLDLPEKLYQKRYVDLSKDQLRLYSQLKRSIITEFKGKTTSAPMALIKLLRLQQIVGGFIQPDVEIVADDDTMLHREPPIAIDKINPRIESMIELLNEVSGKAIIFARFRCEIEAIRKRLCQEFGSTSIVDYHGGISNADRQMNVKAFQEDDNCRFFVANVMSAGKGLTLHAASTVIYYSNTFSGEDRWQSEDRAHRIGQRNNVTYVDIIAPGTLDEKIVDVLRSKKSLADIITGDEGIDWI